MLRSSWDTLSGTGLGKGKKGKVPHQKPQASPSPTPSLTFLPAPSCPGSLPGIQQFLQVPRPAWTCPGPPEDKKGGFRLPPNTPAHARAHTHTHCGHACPGLLGGFRLPPNTPVHTHTHIHTHAHTHARTHTHCGGGGEKLKNRKCSEVQVG